MNTPSTWGDERAKARELAGQLADARFYIAGYIALRKLHGLDTAFLQSFLERTRL